MENGLLNAVDAALCHKGSNALMTQNIVLGRPVDYLDVMPQWQIAQTEISCTGADYDNCKGLLISSMAEARHSSMQWMP